MSASRATSAQRIWSIRDALVALALLVGAGAGVVLWHPGVAAWPRLLPPLVATAALCVLAVRVFVMSGDRRWSPRAARVAMAVVFALFVLWYILLQPIYGPGSDNAEALELGVHRLVHGENPWDTATRFGNPLSPMLGGYLLAAPFVLLTGSVYALPIVWMALLVVVLVRAVGVHAALTVGALFLCSPHTRLWLPNQSDNWVVAVAVLLTSWWGLTSMRSQRQLAQWTSALLFGVALSYRFTLWVVVVPVAVLFVREFGWRRAIGWMTLAGVVTVALSFGPLLVDAQSYLAGPFAIGVGKAADSGVPAAPLLVAAATLTVLVWRSARVRCWADVWMAVSLSLSRP